MTRSSVMYQSAVGAAVIAVAMLPFFFLGTSAAVLIGDSVDSQFVHAVILARHDLIAASGDTIVPDLLSGVPRGYFESPFSIYLWLFEIFPPFGALVANEILLRIIAFAGMSALVARLTRHHGQDSWFIPAMTAGAFTVLPFYSAAGGSVAGMPLFIWAALSVRERGWSAIPIVAMSIYVCYAWLFVFGVFVLAALSAVWLADLVRARPGAWRLFQFLVLASLLFVMREYQLFEIMLIDKAVVHRSEFDDFPVSVAVAIRISMSKFINGDSTAPTLAVPVVFLTVISALVLELRRANGSFADHRVKLIAATLLLVGTTSLLAGFRDVFGIATLSRAYGIPYFNFSRFSALQPVAWFTAFGAALSLLRAHFRKPATATLVVAGLVGAQAVATVLRLPWYRGDVPEINESYVEFFAPPLFSWVRREIPATAKVGVVGMHPAVAQFSGLATIDGYLNIYPLETKRRIGRIIASELRRDENLGAYFNNWGSRAYLFSAEIGFTQISRPRPGRPVTLRYNMAAFAAAGGTHILSTRQIANARALKLTCLGIFRSRNYTPLFVYAASGRSGVAAMADATSCRDRGYAPAG